MVSYQKVNILLFVIKNLSRQNGIIIFVTDIFMNIIIMMVVMSGTSLFPAILRGIVDLLKHFVP
jgi:hypothetical protein